MQSEDFSLATNAFRILGATYTTTSTEIADLVHDGGYSGNIAEDVLQKAQQILITPRLRLAAELAWLPELSAAQATSVLSDQTTLTTSTLLSKVLRLPELARANILADFASSHPIDPAFAMAVFDAWQALDPDDIYDFLAETRRTAGQPMPDREAMGAGLQELRAQHAVSLISGLVKRHDSATGLQEVIAHEIRKDDTDPLLNMVVRDYEKRGEREASRISDAIGEILQSIRIADGTITPLVAALSEQLQMWMALTTPLNEFYAWRGHPEPRSKAIFHQVRDVAIWLANERELHPVSHQISSVLINAFVGIEELRRIAAKDVEDLDEIVSTQRDVERFQPLYDAMENAKASPADFARVAKERGMKRGAASPVGPFVLAIDRFLTEGGDVDMVAVVARELALSFNNDAEQPEIAYLVLDYVNQVARTKMSEQTKQKYDEDLATIFRNWKLPLLEKHKGDVPRLIAALESDVAAAPAGAKSEFASLLTMLKGKQRAKRVKQLVWLAIVGIIVFVVIASGSDKRSLYSSSSYGSGGSSGSSSSSPIASTPGPLSAEPVDLKQETKPTISTGQTLSRNEIRYCIFQGKRLDLLRDLSTPNAEIERFNALVDDFNSRCASYRYRQSDMSAVESEAASRTSTFRQEASAIARSW